MAVNPIQVQKFLGGVDHPIAKQDLVEHAKRRGADESVTSTLGRLPFDELNSPNDVGQAVGRLG